MTADAVRLLLGQTSTADDVLLYDEEISWALTDNGSNARRAAIVLARALAARYAGFPERESVLSQDLTWGDRAEKFAARAMELETEIARRGVSPYVGGISVSDVRTQERDTDRVKPAFAIGQDDHPGVPPGSTGST